MSPEKSSYPTIAGPGYSNISEEQEKDLNTSYMKMIEFFKEEMNKVLKEVDKNTNNLRK